jgi:hypothetical protein
LWWVEGSVNDGGNEVAVTVAVPGGERFCSRLEWMSTNVACVVTKRVKMMVLAVTVACDLVVDDA